MKPVNGEMPCAAARVAQSTKGLSPNNRIDARRNGVSQQAKASSRAVV